VSDVCRVTDELLEEIVEDIKHICIPASHFVSTSLNLWWWWWWW
jgi:hypothetical protein